jgi:hypothetical protein
MSGLSPLWHDLILDPVAGFTAVLAGVTAILAISTIGLWIVTWTAGKTAKRGLESLERPIVFGGITETGIAAADGRLTQNNLRLSISNSGRTPARLRRIEWDIRLAPSGGIAEPIDPTKMAGRELPVGILCVPGGPYEEVEKLFPRFSQADSDEVRFQRQTVWVLGFVRYEDVFGQHHLSGFALAYDQIGRRFVRRGGDRYNYERVEKPRNIPRH